MPQLIYTFSFDTETKRAVKSGNINAQQALHLLADILVAEIQSESNTGPAPKTEEFQPT